MLSTQEIAQEVLKIIPNPRRWLKEDVVSFRGTRLCVRGALNCMTLSETQEHDFGGRFCRTAVELYPDYFRTLYRCGEPMIEFVNDENGIRYAHIRAILEKIAAG